MNTHHARPVQFMIPAGDRHSPSIVALARLVRERAAQLYPDVPRDAIDRAARQSAEKALATDASNPSVTASLPELALREARALIGLYLALVQQNHLRLVA